MTRQFVFDPYAHEFHDDPYPTYHTLLEEHPAYHNDELDLWVLTRFEDVWSAVHDPETFSSEGGITLQDVQPEETRFSDAVGLDVDIDAATVNSVLPMMIMIDPPRHGQLRALVKKAFTPRRIAALEDRVRAVASDLLDDYVEAGGGDLVSSFAGPLPTTVIAELLGVPTEDRDTFRAWSGNMVSFDARSESLTAATAEAFAALYAYFTEIVAQRRAAPRDDLLSALIAARENDQALTEPELIAFCFLLLLAGNETTANLISNTTLQLARHPDQRALLVAEPDLLPNAVEEFLRYDSPVQALGRVVRRPIELHGERLVEGARVSLTFGAANRDPREFPEPDRLDLTRKIERHLAFGHGIHYCLGASLARLEATVAFEELLRRTPDYEVVTDGVQRVHSGMIRGLTKLPLELPTRRAA